ncbi:MAG: hypothetical protein ACU0CO_08695 [Shimia sp.]
MAKRISPAAFRDDEGGAVTVDWVVITAAIVALGVAVVSVIATSATTTSAGIGKAIDDVEVGKLQY